MCDLSIIVPVYNAEDYIERTVKILLEQKIDSMEIILVDDGSVDESGEICDRLSKIYEKVKCIHIKNSGPGYARNQGIIEAQGRYIGFCDAVDRP